MGKILEFFRSMFGVSDRQYPGSENEYEDENSDVRRGRNNQQGTPPGRCLDCVHFDWQVKAWCGGCNHGIDQGVAFYCGITNREVDKNSSYCTASHEGMVGSCALQNYAPVDAYNGRCGYGSQR